MSTSHYSLVLRAKARCTQSLCSMARLLCSDLVIADGNVIGRSSGFLGTLSVHIVHYLKQSHCYGGLESDIGSLYLQSLAKQTTECKMSRLLNFQFVVEEGGPAAVQAHVRACPGTLPDAIQTCIYVLARISKHPVRLRCGFPAPRTA